MEHAHLDGVAVGAINATPLWFAWHDGKVWAYCRGQKVDNMRRTGQCTVLVDRAERFMELQGIMIQGDAVVLEDAAAESAEPAWRRCARSWAASTTAATAGSRSASRRRWRRRPAGRSWRWVVITPNHIVTWDNNKIGR